MNRIDEKFYELKLNHKKAFIAFITAGYPNINTTKSLILKLESCGVDIIELGVPFSDPLADGPTIQQASTQALKNKVSLSFTLKFVKRLRKETKLPIVLLSYYNPIFRYGIKKFVQDAKNSGVDGIITPDLPPEEGRSLLTCANKYELAHILILSPTSTLKRIKLISSLSKGFIYYVSLTGTTGVRDKLPSEISHNVKLIKKLTDKPVCVGFGISKPQHVAQILKIADGVIVGSAIIKVIKENLGKKYLVKKVGQFVRKLREAIP